MENAFNVNVRNIKRYFIYKGHKFDSLNHKEGEEEEKNWTKDFKETIRMAYIMLFMLTVVLMFPAISYLS